MSEFLPEPIILRLFQRLRQSGFSLGLNEYLAALDALAEGFGASNLDGLKQMLRMLWCHSLSEQSRFELIWPEILPAAPELIEPSEISAELPSSKSQNPLTLTAQKTFAPVPPSPVVST